MKVVFSAITTMVNCHWIILLFFGTNNNFCAQNKSAQIGPGKYKSTIVLNESSDGSFSEYSFYNDSGELVKKMRHDEFESKHPIFQLNLPKTNSGNSDGLYFDNFVSFSTENNKFETKKNAGAIISELKSLDKFGMKVKTPEKATVIIGHPFLDLRPIVSKPSNKFLIKIETARVLNAFASGTEEKTNTLLDCSYITIYNYLGEIFKEILVPDKIVSYASISDDGKYLVCVCEYSFVWDEGLSSYPEGVKIIDLNTKKMDYIISKETLNRLEISSVLYDDGFFQMTFKSPWSGEMCYRFFISPQMRAYYTKEYAPDPVRKRKAIMAKSFMQFEGVKENLNEFVPFSY